MSIPERKHIHAPGQIINYDDFLESIPKEDSVIIFGGTFDPIHEGHIQDIRKLLDIAKVIIIAPTSQNPWKEFSPTSLDNRLEMIRMVLHFEKIPFSEKVTDSNLILSSVPYVYACNLLFEIRQTRESKAPGEYYYWAIGEDLIKSAINWKNWKSNGVPFVSLPILDGISATKVRERNIKPHPAIADYIKCHNFYK
ncbi:MAG TPA: adenylyltransferase/cytidyltransferase family protein [Oligoflexia bacterium]|nr:adenylyltransferase/cytidyltransferase family protein [Oligoflexia bacterium]HMP48738.1 adenylyltransferase/cytidyltransferase family protein [Oligoflexia bacterium]